ncbi:hypothetical protein Tco_1204969 [Tanacetum coccineum]
MNPQETQQVVARDKKWVPSTERVKISSTNLRLETTVPQKEETFQVVNDIIKNSTCFKAFTISADVPEIFMQQFWYTIKKVQGTDSYEFLLANKNCRVNAEVFRKILDICQRVEGEDYQEYGRAIPDVMLNDAIKQSESYQMFIKYSTEIETKPEPVKRKTASRRVVKNKVTISANDNIIPNPDVALELGKSISLAEAEEEEAAKQVHATHARIMTESILESAKKKTGSRGSTPKLKSVQSLTPAEKEAADIMQALKESKKTSKRQLGTGGSSEGTGTILGVLDESIVVSATSSEGTVTKPGVPDEEKC